MGGLVKLQPVDLEVSKGVKTTFGESVGAGFREAAPLVGAGRMLEDEINEPVRDLLQQVMPADAIPGGRGSGRGLLSKDLARSVASQGNDRLDAATLQSVLDELDAVGFEYPDAVRPANMQDRRTDRLTDVAEGRAREREIIERGGTAGTIASFVGGVGAEFTDPVNVATLPLGAPARAGLAVTVAVEATVNALLEGAQTGGRNRILAEMGEAEESLAMNMLTGAAFGGILPVAIKSGVVAVRGSSAFVSQFITAPRARRRELAKAAADNNSPAAQEAAKTILKDVEDEAEAVTVETPEAVAEHQTRAQEAVEAASEGRVPDMPDRPAVAVPRVADDGSELVDPRELLVQPDVFQFKSEIVARGGVTQKLQGVTEWVPHRAGVAIVYEYPDGSRAIADGHQRTALARRIMEQDPSQDIRMRAEIFRADDGYSIEDIRVLSALKNIAEAADGMTAKMAGDAAKVLRLRPAAIADLPRGPGIARAQNLSKLSDDAFDLYINRVIDERFAEQIGRMVDDPSMHMPIARLIERVRPETTEQASNIISQALEAPTSRETTSDLFGDTEVVESLYLEQAKVLERSMQIMREDQSVFRTLTEKAESIERVGENTLDRTTNAEARQQVETALAAIKALAHRAGPISEALRDGAKSYKETGRFKDAAQSVADAVRGEVQRTGLDGLATGTGGRRAKPAPAGEKSPDPSEGFSDPIGQAAKDQVEATEIEVDLEAEVTDLFDQVPEGRGFDEDGKEIAITKSRADVVAELADDDEFLDVLEVCL